MTELTSDESAFTTLATPKSEETEQTLSGNAPIFRKEFVAARQRKYEGEIFLSKNPTHWSWVAAAVTCALLLICYIWIGEYTKKERVTGQIILTRQTVKHFSPVAGIVAERYLTEGAKVLRGDPLFRIYVDHINASKGEMQGAIAKEIEARRTKLLDEKKLQMRVLEEETQMLTRKVGNLQQQINKIDAELSAQSRRLSSNSENLARIKNLSDEEIISTAEYQEKRQDNLSLQAQIATLERSKTSLIQEKLVAQSDLLNAPLKARNQISSVARSIHELEQQAIDNEAKREITVVALSDGEITGILASAGQQVNSTFILASILPDGAEFISQLYVPSRAVGFLQTGGAVMLRYQAFPYQKFGQTHGLISSIDKTALSPAELQISSEIKEPLYRVQASVDKQYVMAYGKKMPLQDGMQLEADLAIDTRKIYEWILEPLYTISGSL